MSIHEVLAELENSPDPRALIESEGISTKRGYLGFKVCAQCPVAKFLQKRLGEEWHVGPTRTWRTSDLDLHALPEKIRVLIRKIDEEANLDHP